MSSFDAAGMFARIRSERTSESGKAATEAAEHIFAGATDVAHLVEARQWARFGLECDKAVADGNLAEALAKAKAKANTITRMDRMREIQDGETPPPKMDLSRAFQSRGH